MLTSYSLDTDDDSLQEKAVALRSRFAGRRIQAAIHSGSVDDRALVQLKNLNRQERDKHSEESAHIISRYDFNKNTLQRADHQLNIQNKLRTLDSDVARTVKLGKSRIDSLTDLEKRIVKMRANLNRPQPDPTVNETMSEQLLRDNNKNVKDLFQNCELCKRKVLKVLFEQHTEMCTKLDGKSLQVVEPVYDLETDEQVMMTTFKPQPPRNCRFVKKSQTYMTFAWDPPVFSGGLHVYQYEVRYKSHTPYLCPTTKMKMVRAVQQPNFFTTMWCMDKPIIDTGCKLGGLLAGQGYCDFQVRAYNLQGYSDWVDLVEPGGPTVIETAEPERPHAPTFFRNVLTTSTCIHLAWDAPIYTGGRPITQYMIMYTVVERHVTATSREHTIPKDKQIRTKGDETELVIRNLPHSTKIIDIRIKAINDFEMTGASSDITWGVRNPTTDPCSYYYSLKEEYLKTKEMEGQFCDTDFFTGITQRLIKADHLLQLEAEMEVSEPTDPEKEESRIWDAIVEQERLEAEELAKLDKLSKLEDDSSDEEDNRVTLAIAGHSKSKKRVKESDFIFPHRVRKKHFQLKIINVDNDLEKYEREKVQIEIDRVANTTLLKERQMHLIKLDLEKDRAFNFEGLDITSSVLQGIPLSYKITNFKEALSKAYDECEADIARAKNSIISGEKRKKMLGGLVERKIEEKKERQAQMKLFLDQSEKQQRVMKNLLHGNHNREALLSGYFNRLRLNVEESIKAKANVTKAFQAIGRTLLASAFEKWSTGKFSQSIHSSDFNGGLGSVMLQKSRKMREEVQSMLREAIAHTAEMSVKLKVSNMPHKQYKRLTSSIHLKEMEEGMSQTRMYEAGGLTFLFEGDGYTLNRKYKQAEDCYEAQIITIRSRAPVNIKQLAMCHGRLGKLYLRMERFDRAIVDFDRQMSLANEIGDKVEVAEAYYGLGSGCLGRYDFLEAIRYLEIAQSRFETIGNAPKHCGCLVAMRECYDRLGKQSMVDIYTKRINEIEGELRNKLNKISTKLSDMTERLRMSSAALEMVVAMERITPVILDLRTEVDNLHEVLDLQEVERDSQHEKVLKVEKLLDAIQGEINEAMETDEVAILSQYVHDQPQLVEVEELKTRLHEKKLSVLENYKVEELHEVESDEDESTRRPCMKGKKEVVISPAEQYHLVHNEGDVRPEFNEKNAFSPNGLGHTKTLSGLNDKSPKEIIDTLWRPAMVHIVKCYNAAIEQDPTSTVEPMTLSVLYRYYGIKIYMALFQRPSSEDFFKDLHCGEKFPALPNFKAYMSHKKFQEITSHLRFENYATVSEEEKKCNSWQVKTISSIVKKSCGRYMPCPGEFISIDEAMIKCCSTKCPLYKLMPHKPHPKGMLLYCAVDDSTQWVFDFNLDVGELKIKDFKGMSWGITGQRVIDLVKHLAGDWHVVSINNFFTSIPVAFELLTNYKQYVVGKFQKKKLPVGCPEEFVNPCRNMKDIITTPKGPTVACVKQTKDIALFSFAGNESVCVLDTAYGPYDITELKRKKGQGSVTMPVYKGVQVYDAHDVSRVDMTEILCNGHYAIGANGRSYWTVRFVDSMLNLQLSQAWAAYRYHNPDKFKREGRFYFYKEICEAFLDNDEDENVSSHTRHVGKKRTWDCGNIHSLVKTTDLDKARSDGIKRLKQEVCRNCNRHGTIHNPAVKDARTHFRCKECNYLPLHPECFGEWHKELEERMSSRHKAF